MNSSNRPTETSLITWKRAKQASRGARVGRLTFRIARNILATLGVCFVYLLIVGYFQYQDAMAQPEPVCGVVAR